MPGSVSPWDRLSQLREEYEELQTEIRTHQTNPTVTNLAGIPADLLDRQRSWRIEAEVITAFSVYETKSIVDMLGGWKVVGDSSELAYLLKVRNLFVAHPSLHAFFRLPRRTITIPVGQGIVTQHVIGLDRLNDYHQRVYARLQGVDAGDIQLNTVRQENESFIRTFRPQTIMTVKDRSRLLGWGAREPNLHQGLVDLARILRQHVVPKIQRLHKQATEQFRYGLSANLTEWPY